MPLKPRIKKIDEVAEALRSLYKQNGDEFLLDLEGDDLTKLGQFRDTNTRLVTEMEGYKTKLAAFDGVDPAALEGLRVAQKQAQAEEEKELLKKGNIDEVFKRRNALLNTEWERKAASANTTIETLKKTNETLNGRLSTLLIDQELDKAIESAGLKPRQGAIADLRTRARNAWKINEKGDPVATGPSGPLYSKEKAGDALTMKEYVTKWLPQEAAHLFEGATGGGAGGSGGSRGGSSGGSPNRISNDPLEFGKNLQAIRDGKTKVDIPGSATGD